MGGVSGKRQETKFTMVLLKDIPPRDVVTLTYTLVAEPIINTEALPTEHRSGIMEFMYDEFDLVREADKRYYTQSILFSNGWEVRLQFSDVQVVLAQPIYPVPARPGEVLQSA